MVEYIHKLFSNQDPTTYIQRTNTQEVETRTHQDPVLFPETWISEDTKEYNKPINEFAHTIINDVEYFHIPYLEKCIETKLKKVPAVANVWLKKIMFVLKKYEELYGNEMLITIPNLCFYIRNLPFLEIVNTNNTHLVKNHNIGRKIFYFPVPRSSIQPRIVNVHTPDSPNNRKSPCELPAGTVIKRRK
jgi:hypothetical protein